MRPISVNRQSQVWNFRNTEGADVAAWESSTFFKKCAVSAISSNFFKKV